jgi:hypothetical protein
MSDWVEVRVDGCRIFFVELASQSYILLSRLDATLERRLRV